MHLLCLCATKVCDWIQTSNSWMRTFSMYCELAHDVLTDGIHSLQWDQLETLILRVHIAGTDHGLTALKFQESPLKSSSRLILTKCQGSATWNLHTVCTISGRLWLLSLLDRDSGSRNSWCRKFRPQVKGRTIKIALDTLGQTEQS